MSGGKRSGAAPLAGARRALRRAIGTFVVALAVILALVHLDAPPSKAAGVGYLVGAFVGGALWACGLASAILPPPRAAARPRPGGREVSLAWWRRLLLAAFPWPILALFIASPRSATWVVVPFALLCMWGLWALLGNRAWLTEETIVWKRPFGRVRRIPWSSVEAVRVILPRAAVYSTDGSMMGVNFLVEDGGAEFAAELLRHGCPVEGDRRAVLEAVASALTGPPAQAAS